MLDGKLMDFYESHETCKYTLWANFKDYKYKKICTQCPLSYTVHRCFHKPTDLKFTLPNSVGLNLAIYHALSITQTALNGAL